MSESDTLPRRRLGLSMHGNFNYLHAIKSFMPNILAIVQEYGRFGRRLIDLKGLALSVILSHLLILKRGVSFQLG